MKRKLSAHRTVYYIISASLYVILYLLMSLIFSVLKNSKNVGLVSAAFFYALAISLPLIIFIVMRFSLFKWYVDPISAAMIPLFLYIGIVFSQKNGSRSFASAVRLANAELNDDGGMGWMLLLGVFILGLVMSFSVARKNGRSVSFRLISSSAKKSAAPLISPVETPSDWDFDFESLRNFNSRNPFTYDKFYPIPQSDALCCIYAISEVRMGWHQGFLAILKDKNSPKLILNIAEKINFRDNFNVDKSGKLIFLQAMIYFGETGEINCPILIIDLEKEKFTYIETDNVNSTYTVEDAGDLVFEIKADEIQKSDPALASLCDKKLDLKISDWYDLSEISALYNKLKKQI